MKDEQKAFFDACMTQVDYFANRWDRRRTDEWKTTIAVWTLTVAGIYFVKQPQVIPYWLTAVFIVGYAFFWLKKVWDANDVEIQHVMFYQREAEAVMRDSTHVLGSAPSHKRRAFYNLAFLGNWSIQFQLLSVVLLAVLFYVVPRPNCGPTH